MRLKNRVALITGAGSGIGEAAALLFAREGASVALADLDQGGTQRVAAAIRGSGGEAAAVHMDVTDPVSVRTGVDATLERFGVIDVLFNNAGISCVGAAHETPPEEFDQVIAVNIKGVFLVTQAVAPHMMERRSGSIINMSSCIAQIGLAKRVAYGATKGAVLSMTRCMQVDYAPYGIRVNALLPGTIFTPFVERYLREKYPDPAEGMASLKKRQLTGELGTPEDVAHAALYLASDEARYVVGAGLVIDGGVTAGK